MAHIIKEVPLIAAALTEPRICDGMRPRRHSDRLGGSGQYDIHVCWCPVRGFRPGDIEIAIRINYRTAFRSTRPETDFQSLCQRFSGLITPNQPPNTPPTTTPTPK